MPRKGAKGKWNLDVSPDEFYFKADPWSIKYSRKENLKADLIRGLIDGDTVIDIGCGEGLFTHTYKTCYWVVGLDISHVAIGRARKMCYDNVEFSQHDIVEEYHWREAETVILSEVLYYIKPELWETVSENIKKIITKKGQFIISVGQYFTEADIRKIFPWCKFDKVFKLPSKKYEYNLIMSGRKR